jgi:long-chain acyl-CoA synthetase
VGSVTLSFVCAVGLAAAPRAGSISADQPRRPSFGAAFIVEPPLSVLTPILTRLITHPTTTAVVDDRRSYRSIELLVAAFNLATEIERTCRTQTVAVMTPTSAGFPIAALAGWLIGKTVVPLNYLLKKEELQYVLDDCGADTLITVGAMLEHLGYTPRVQHTLKLEELNLGGVPEPRWPHRAAADDLAILLYTSGTSGKPKGVMLTHGNLSANLDSIRRHVDFTSADVMLGVLPQFHSFGMTVLTLLPLAFGIKVVYTARFVPGKLVRLMREHKPTIFIAIPSMYNALLAVKDAGPEDLASLRFTVSGGEPLPDAVAERLQERFGKQLNEGFGLTETAPVTHWCRPFEHRAHSVGTPIPDVEQRIYDITSPAETPVFLPPGHEGEIQLRGPNIMKGYYKLPNETAAAFTADGWFRTGDIGKIDADGFLYITGRLKEMLIVGGENVFPREIEEALNKHSSVNASGVIGEKDPMRGELPVAFVEMREGETFDEKALLQHCRGLLAGYKVPSRIIKVDALPRNPTGKIMRRQLKELL